MKITALLYILILLCSTLLIASDKENATNRLDEIYQNEITNDVTKSTLQPYQKITKVDIWRHVIFSFLQYVDYVRLSQASKEFQEITDVVKNQPEIQKWLHEQGYFFYKPPTEKYYEIDYKLPREEGFRYENVEIMFPPKSPSVNADVKFFFEIQNSVNKDRPHSYLENMDEEEPEDDNTFVIPPLGNMRYIKFSNTNTRLMIVTLKEDGTATYSFYGNPSITIPSEGLKIQLTKTGISFNLNGVNYEIKGSMRARNYTKYFPIAKVFDVRFKNCTILQKEID